MQINHSDRVIINRYLEQESQALHSFHDGDRTLTAARARGLTQSINMLQ